MPGEDDSAVLVGRSGRVAWRPQGPSRSLGRGPPKGSLVFLDSGEGVAEEAEVESSGFGGGL